jgi:hypothetical protein
VEAGLHTIGGKAIEFNEAAVEEDYPHLSVEKADALQHRVDGPLMAHNFCAKALDLGVAFVRNGRLGFGRSAQQIQEGGIPRRNVALTFTSRGQVRPLRCAKQMWRARPTSPGKLRKYNVWLLMDDEAARGAAGGSRDCDAMRTGRKTS